MHNGKLQRNSKKIKNIKKNHYGVISSQNRLENSVKERIKILVPFRSYPKRNRKYHKNTKKFKKYHYSFILSQNRLENDEKDKR